MGYLPGIVAYRDLNQPQREKCFKVNKAEKGESFKSFNLRNEIPGLEVFLAVFQSYLVHNLFIMLVLKAFGTVLYIVYHFILEIWNLFFYFTGGYSYLLEFQM